jgi:uroporphyrinogen-III synthase
VKQPLVVLRPEPGLSETLAAATAMGLTAIPAPLFAIEAVAWPVPEAAEFDAIIAGSANAFRCGGAHLGHITSLPVYAVGERTAQAARAAGFTVTSTGEGGLQAVLDAFTAPVRLLRLAGEKRLALQVPRGCTMAERVVYRAVPLDLDCAVPALLQGGAVVLLHSAEAAARFADECERKSIDRARVSIAGFGPRIVSTAGTGWRTAVAADRPTDARLLALAATLCQD